MRHTRCTPARRQRSPIGAARPPGGTGRALLIAGGVVAGMFAGAALGSTMTRDGGDSPGMQGAIVGFFAGGALGGYVVWFVTR